MKMRPRNSCQYSGIATVKMLFAPLTNPAPSTGPIRVPRPPSATQMAASMELVGDISLGLMIPTCGTYNAPARPQSTADSVHTSSLKPRGSYPQNISRFSASRTAVRIRPNLLCASAAPSHSVSNSSKTVAINRLARVPVAVTGKPSSVVKPVKPLFPPNPVSLRKNSSIPA